MDTQLLRKIVVLKMLATEYENKAKAIKAAIPALSKRAHEQFLAEGTQSCILQPTVVIDGKEIQVFTDGAPRKVEPIIKNKPSIKVGDQAEMYQWFKDNGHGTIVKETIFAASLTSWVNAQKTANLPVPEKVTVFEVEDVKITKARAKSTK